jgi:very-short-patch-repair endonuclease
VPKRLRKSTKPRTAAINLGEMLFNQHCMDKALPAPQRQYLFATSLKRKWRFDFAWPEFKLAVEIDGGIWIVGAHAHPTRILDNMEKGNAAVLLGWYVLHFSVAQVTKSMEAIEFTLRVIEDRMRRTIIEPHT